MKESPADAPPMSRRLLDEAMAAATRLGHRMTSWVAVGSEEWLFVARCQVCSDLVEVSERNPHGTPIEGAAVKARCPFGSR